MASFLRGGPQAERKELWAVSVGLSGRLQTAAPQGGLRARVFIQAHSHCTAQERIPAWGTKEARP